MATADILRGVQDSKDGSEQLMVDFPVTSGEAESAGVAAPTITAHLDHIVTGAGFLPNCSVTVRVTYVADQASDYLAFSADMCGWLYAELPTSPSNFELHVSATDHRTDPSGGDGLLWSNTAIMPAPP
jgi:hypothetical protein